MVTPVKSIALISLSGWHDAGGAGASAIDTVLTGAELLDRQVLSERSHYVLTVSRPVREAAGAEVRISYPELVAETFVLIPRAGAVTAEGAVGVRCVVVSGPEPSLGWQELTAATVDMLDVDLVIGLESVPANVAHTLPLPVQCLAADPQAVAEFGVEHAALAAQLGPVGFLDVLVDTCAHAQIPAAKLVVDVPMYAAGGHNPKAALTLVHTLDQVLKLGVDTRNLDDEAHAWESGVNAMVRAEPDLRAWVERLENRTDVSRLPQARGDNIAAEFERFLRSRRR